MKVEKGEYVLAAQMTERWWDCGSREAPENKLEIFLSSFGIIKSWTRISALDFISYIFKYIKNKYFWRCDDVYKHIRIFHIQHLGHIKS